MVYMLACHLKSEEWNLNILHILVIATSAKNSTVMDNSSKDEHAQLPHNRSRQIEAIKECACVCVVCAHICLCTLSEKQLKRTLKSQ